MDISDGNSVVYVYDNVNNVSSTAYTFAGVTKTTKYPSYFKGGVVQNVTYPNGAIKTRSLNGQAQVRPSTLTTPTGKTWSINRQYYTPNPNDTVKYTTNIIGSLIYENIDRTFSYTYDGSGNISKIRDKTGTTAKESAFVYDEAGQLIRENNAYTNKTVTYTYDAGGNILKRTEYPFTTGSLDGQTGTVVNYTYGNTNWKDLLTEFDGNAITYDAIGNPLTYYNGTSFTWNYGRKLATATTSDGTSISYKYNDSGIRTSKTVDGVKTEYFLDGSRIVAEKTGSNTKWYYYDGDGTREAIEYNGNVYYYFYNAQGDVVGLFDNNLNVVVNYTYDSWGNVVSITGSLASTLGQDNPFRYRGYYFDNETGLYYLNSRYYDSNTGRFINADGYVQTGQGVLDKNMFAYCGNNPVNMIDSSGDCYYNAQGEWCHDNWEQIPNKDGISFLSTKARGGDGFKPRKDKRKGSDNRQKSGSRERNVGHENGEEHSRVPKGNRAGVSRMEPIVAIGVLTITSVVIVVIVADDTTAIGVIDDFLLPPVMKLCWDVVCASQI